MRSKERLITVCQSLNIRAVDAEDWTVLHCASGAWDNGASAKYLLTVYETRLRRVSNFGRSPHVRELAEELLSSIEDEQICHKTQS